MERRWAAGGTTAGRSLLALALTVGLGTAGCGGDGDPSQADPDRSDGDTTVEDDGSTAGTLELDPVTTTTTTPEDGALSQLLPEASPLPGFDRADDVLGAGPLDLAAAAAAEADVDAERSRLEARGFVRGASRAWTGDGQDVVYLAIYEFDRAEGASGYLEDVTGALASRAATQFDVPGVAGATGFTTVEASDEGTFTAHAVTFTQGELWVLVLVGSPESTRTEEDARAVAAAQAALLG